MRATTGLLCLAVVAGGLATAWLLRSEPSEAVPRGEPAAPSRVAADPGPAPVPLAVLGGRSRSALEAARLPRDVVPSAPVLRFLLACQDDVGEFREDLGRVEGDPPPRTGRETFATAVVCLALVDASSPTDDVPASRAARRGLDRLAALQGADGTIGPDLESHVLASWALAAGYSRSGRSEWGRTVPASVRATLAAAHPDGGWREGAALDRSVVLTAWAVAGLFEALPLDETVPDEAPLRDAIDVAAEWAVSIEPASVARSGAASAALALLRRVAGERAEPLGPDSVLRPEGIDHAAACLGTVLSFHDEDLWPSWRDRVLLPALARRRREGPGEGSWDPSGGLGRVEATALEMLSFLAVSVPYREPQGR